MSRDKQMIYDLIEIFDEEYSKRYLITPQNTAEKLTAKGYRKASEVAREIFCIIDDIVESWKLETRSKETGELIRTAYNGTMIAKCIAELKKKYTQGKEEIPPYVRMGAKALPAILNVKYTEGEKDNGEV